MLGSSEKEERFLIPGPRDHPCTPFLLGGEGMCFPSMNFGVNPHRRPAVPHVTLLALCLACASAARSP